ncbi:MAG: ribosome silencing factor [Bacteroidales bacterium]|nr:ribosome silencing factor [Bacteroidales bacterium]
MAKKKKDALVAAVIDGIQDIKGKGITVMDLREVDSSVCDYFVICEGNSSTHVSSLADSIEDKVREEVGEKPYHIEGRQNAQWVLMDYYNVVVHIFQKEARAFYSLETLWDDAKSEQIPDLD